MSTIEEKREAYVQEKISKEGVRTLKKARKLWIFGLFGVHKFYLNHMGSGLAMLTLTLAFLFVLFTDIGFYALGIAFIWWILDFFRLPKLVQTANEIQREYYEEEAQRRIH
ncbi:TM2 domain-containing protein [Kurthia massiliensis]|uniref:TM2 domain-containing protein n=1 Tax=Kurthia massiliensis TaxID=1033739 RepID=UPI000287F981|nr:TM2 domain-containing protein [Kurthia massiliensis]